MDKMHVFQNGKSDKVITSTLSNKWGTSKNPFQRIEENLRKFQEAGFCNVKWNFPRLVRHLRIFVFSITLNFTKCRNNFGHYHFKRLKKNQSNQCKTSDNTKKVATPSSFSCPNFHSTCTFYDKSNGYLGISRTFGIDRCVREGVLLLSDEKLIAKLSMHAIEANYHPSCLCSFYSILRTIEKRNKDYYENSITYSIVLFEVVNFIKKTLKASQTAPAFILSGLTFTVHDWKKEVFLKFLDFQPIDVENK